MSVAQTDWIFPSRGPPRIQPFSHEQHRPAKTHSQYLIPATKRERPSGNIRNDPTGTAAFNNNHDQERDMISQVPCPPSSPEFNCRSQVTGHAS